MKSMNLFSALCIALLLLCSIWLFFYLTQDGMAKNDSSMGASKAPAKVINNEVNSWTNKITAKGRSAAPVGSPEAIKQRALGLGLNLAIGYAGAPYDKTRPFTYCHAAEQNGYVVKERTITRFADVFWKHVYDDQGPLGWCPEAS